jgi:hypothetical protein
MSAEHVAYGLSFPRNIPEVLHVLGQRQLTDGVPVCQEKLRDCHGVFLESWLREAGNRLYSGFCDPGSTAFSCLTDLTPFIAHLSVGGRNPL